MATVTSLSYVFAKRPTAEIVPGETFRAVTGPAPTEEDLKDGEVLFETYYLGIEPSMRIWLKGSYTATGCFLLPVVPDSCLGLGVMLY